LGPIAALFILLMLMVMPAVGGTPTVTAHDLQGGFSLAGQWRFMPGDDMAWARPAFDDSQWTTRPMPGRWEKGGLPGSGQMAWYRLTLELPDGTSIHHLAVRLGEVMGAYELYVGGRLLGGVGKLPPLGELDYDRQRVYPIPADAVGEDGRLSLALRVWGGGDALASAWRVGPYGGRFLLGEYRDLLVEGLVGEVPALLVCTLFIGFGLYHLYLYRRNPQLDSLMWFGLVAINIGIYGLMLTQWKYMTGWPFLALKKIELGSIYLFPALAIQSIWSLLQQPIGSVLRAYQASFILLAGMVLLVPGHAVHYNTLEYWQVWSLPLLLIGPGMVLREARAGNREARTLSVGLLIFVATCLNDLSIDLANLQTVRLTPFGFVAVMIAMSVSLANRFTSVISEMEHLVDERTAELSAANTRLAEVARLDPLTGVLNRRGFTSEVDSEIERFFRSGRQFTIVLADVDHFKRFNDEFGHACGDHVLKRAAEILLNRLRDVDRIGRWGGEEFILLLPETDTEGAAILAEDLRDAIAGNLFEFAGERHRITMTFGVAAYRKGESLDGCIARADTALYHGKKGGRNRVMIGRYKGLTLVG
jgi:diguanylate cyclase (GGDEF)-like protein